MEEKRIQYNGYLLNERSGCEESNLLDYDTDGDQIHGLLEDHTGFGEVTVLLPRDVCHTGAVRLLRKIASIIETRGLFSEKCSLLECYTDHPARTHIDKLQQMVDRLTKGKSHAEE